MGIYQNNCAENTLLDDRHENGAPNHQHCAERRLPTEWFAQEEQGKNEDKDNAGPVDGSHCSRRTDLECKEVAEPGQSTSNTRQDDEGQGFIVDAADGRKLAEQQRHDNQKSGHNNGPDRGCKGGINVTEADFAKDCDQGSKDC